MVAETSGIPQAPPASARRIAFRAVALLVTVAVLYFFWPKVLDVLEAWPRLRDMDPVWFTAAVASELVSFWCVWFLLRLALGTRAWFAVVCSQLSANAASRLVPGGAAAGAAVQYRMLTQAGIDASGAGSAMTAVALLQYACLFALPLVTIPLIVLDSSSVPDGLVQAVWIGFVAFVLVVGLGSLLLTVDSALRRAGKLAGWIVCKVRHRPVDRELPDRLVAQRNEIRAALGARWKHALLAALGNWAFDYGALLACLAAVGSRPHPSLVLLAYAGAAILAMIPLTPGGLGFVEAGLTSLLVLAGVGAGEAVLATLGYRLLSFWLPLPAGAVAYPVFRRRYGRRRVAATGG
jgi:uncharacterized protein (TIRG00374 family)